MYTFFFYIKYLQFFEGKRKKYYHQVRIYFDLPENKKTM